MLHILFLILKIIGIILLVILGITLMFIGVILFVPIRYRIKTETTNGMKELRTEARATWLMHLISAHIFYQDEKLDWQARIGWKRFRGSEDETDEEMTPDKAVASDKNVTSSMETVSDKTTASEREEAPDKNKTSTREKAFEETITSEKAKGNRFKKIKCTIKEICGKIKNIKEFLLEETHIQAFLRLKKEILFFIRKIKPDKLKGYLRFGLEDPYDTGRVLAALSVLYPFYGEHFQVYPEFEQEIIEGDVYFKGRIHLVHLLLVLGRSYFDKNVKTAYKNLKALKG